MLGKYLTLIFMVVTAWYVISWCQRFIRVGRRLRQEQELRRKGGGVEAASAPPGGLDLVRCPVCQVYAPARGAPCGRPDCPRRP